MMALQQNQNQIAIPPDLICSITRDLMDDPVIAADGQSYEREAIEAWLSSGRQTSPYTGAPLRNLDLIPNYNLKKIIIEFKESIPVLERQQQIATDFEEACRLREKEINELQVKQNENPFRKLYEEEKNKNKILNQKLEEMQKELEQMQLNNNDLLSIRPESRLHFLRKTHIFMIPSQSTRGPINLKDVVQKGSLMRGDNDASAITQLFGRHYYVFFRTENYYLTLELRKSICKTHKKNYQYICVKNSSLRCSDCQTENENENSRKLDFEEYNRKSLVDFSIQNKPIDAPTNPKPSKEDMSQHLARQEIFTRYYPSIVKTWNTRHLTIGDLLTEVEKLTKAEYGFLSFNCRDFAMTLQEFTMSQ